MPPAVAARGNRVSFFMINILSDRNSFMIGKNYITEEMVCLCCPERIPFTFRANMHLPLSFEQREVYVQSTVV